MPVSEELREHVAKRFRKVEKQVSELAELEVELLEERNPAIADSEIAEATLHLKGVTLRARAASPDIAHSINMVSEELSRQVKRHRDKRRGRRQARAAAGHPEPAPPVLEGEVVLDGDVVLEAEVIPSTDTFGTDVSSAA
jgi:putative sigma-54 modulation protein